MIVAQLVKKFPSLIWDPKGSLPFSQDLAIGSYPETE
jgi:hypothetical protein